MRYIDKCCRVIRFHPKHLTRGQRLKPFAGFQNGQGAQQPFGIKISVIGHAQQLGAMLQLVHQLVTSGAVTYRVGSLK